MSCDTCPTCGNPLSVPTDSDLCPDPNCGQVLISLSSTDELLCTGCRKVYEWLLKEGQESVLIEGKVGGRR